MFPDLAANCKTLIIKPKCSLVFTDIIENEKSLSRTYFLLLKVSMVRRQKKDRISLQTAIFEF
jgi:hypothetical protein